MKKHSLKYGENPHQQGQITIDPASKDPLGIARFRSADGTSIEENFATLGWVNLKDLQRGLEALTRIASAFEVNFGKVPKIAVVIEHGNACGASCGDTEAVINNAIQGNYRAAFGSFLVTNVAMTDQVSFAVRQWMVANRPFAGIAAPEIDEMAVAYFQRKKGKCHLIANPAMADLGVHSLCQEPISHSIRGAVMTQTPSSFVPKFPKEWPDGLKADMCLAWGVCSASNSNSITIAKDGMIIANAVGQQERAAACELAINQVKHNKRTAQLKGAAVVSDSFFPFADGLDMLARRKVGAIFATSGSIHDKEVAAHAAQFETIFFTVPDTKGRIFAGH
jgi:phosphoribosylaminoimidazolecarboxamide formyltransferase/IMP cyclohydrolase